MVFQSCDDYVDIQPRGNSVPRSVADVDLLLNAGNNLNARQSALIPSLVSDNNTASQNDIAAALNDGFNSYIGRIVQLEDLYYLPSQTDNGYKEDYDVINLANYILSLLETEFTEASDLRTRLMGEAYAHRAFHYFSVVNKYGHHYGHGEAGDAESGVPIVTTWGDATVDISRRSVNDVYALIMSDLDQAESMLDNSRGHFGRPNLAAAQGLKARVYLHMGDYQNALSYAENALLYNSTLYDYNAMNPFFPTLPIEGANPESVFYKEDFVPYISLPDWSQLLFSKFSPELTALYDATNDLRLLPTVADFGDGNLVWGGLSAFSYRYFKGISVPELMLIQAECLARISSEDYNEAITVLNTLRASRYSTASVGNGDHLLTAADRAEAIAHVIDERRREFHVTGMRFFDIKRLNAIENAGISLTRGSVTYSANGVNWAVPFSPDVLNSSGGAINQNERE